jgi:hypothetical protein
VSLKRVQKAFGRHLLSQLRGRNPLSVLAGSTAVRRLTDLDMTCDGFGYGRVGMKRERFAEISMMAG